MQEVGGYLIFWHAFFHDIFHIFHLEIVLSVGFHETFLEKDFLIEETLISG